MVLILTPIFIFSAIITSICAIVMAIMIFIGNIGGLYDWRNEKYKELAKNAEHESEMIFENSNKDIN